MCTITIKTSLNLDLKILDYPKYNEIFNKYKLNLCGGTICSRCWCKLGHYLKNL